MAEGEQRTFGELFKDISREFSGLFRDEVALARAEIRETVSQALKDVVLAAVGGFVLYAGALALIAAAVLGLANVVEPWLSALIVGAVVTLVGAILLMRGIADMRSLKPMPERTAKNVQADAETVRRNVTPPTRPTQEETR